MASDTGTSYREQLFIQEGTNKMWFRGSVSNAWAELGGGSPAGVASGATLTDGNFNNAVTSGFFWVTASSYTNAPPYSTTFTSGWNLLVVAGNGNSQGVIQIATLNSISHTRPYLRTRNGTSTWTSWIDLTGSNFLPLTRGVLTDGVGRKVLIQGDGVHVRGNPDYGISFDSQGTSLLRGGLYFSSNTNNEGSIYAGGNGNSFKIEYDKINNRLLVMKTTGNGTWTAAAWNSAGYFS
jgi:hypothetical protein